jgi:hypothetical protein
MSFFSRLPEVAMNRRPGVEVVRAVRPVARGEEITVCYLDLSMAGRVTREQRRAALAAGYGFLCRCEACGLEGGAAQEEDRLRLEAWSLAQCRGPRPAHLLLERAERLLALRERLQFKVTHQLDTLGLVWGLAMLEGREGRAGEVAARGAAAAAIRCLAPPSSPVQVRAGPLAGEGVAGAGQGPRAVHARLVVNGRSIGYIIN